MTGIYDADAELYRAWLAGNGVALESLVARHSDALVRFAYSYTGDEAAAEDVAADAFAVLVFKRRPFAEGARFRTYLYKIARNRALDLLRRNRRLTALPEGADTARYTVVCSLAEEGLAVEDANAFFSYTDTVYVSGNNIFVARSHDLAGQVIACGAEGSCSYSEDRTEIACLAYEGGAFTYRGTADVPGTVKDQYSLDERNGQLRVVTTLYRWGLQTEGNVSGPPPLGTNAGVYIVDLADFQTVGALEWFAPQGECVMSARFEKEEDLVWVCTAVEFTDPVFRIDLSDPAHITYTETGTVEGYSHTLIDFTDGTLLGIGYGESTWELKIELYEKQGGEVVSLDAYTADETISTDYKAYFIDRENGLVGMQVYNGGESEYLVLAYDGYGLTEALRLPMADGDYDNTRAAYIGGWLYILSDDETGFYAVQL